MFNSNCASVPLVASIDGGYGGNNGFLNGDGLWGLIIILALLGWGGNGGFGFGGFGGGNNGTNGAGFQGWATRADVNEGFALNNLQSGINAIQNGICSSTYEITNQLNNGFHNQTVATLQGFNGVQAGQNAIQAQLASCCCDLQTAIQGVNYNMATNACDIKNTIQNTTRDIIDNQNANNRALMDFLVNDKIATLTAENQSLKFAASQQAQNAFITANQEAQTAELIRRLGADCPQPAYVVQPPTPVNFPNWNCNTCGC